MPRPESIEDMLSRLIPPALSDGGQARIEEMLDDLAGLSATASPAPAPTAIAGPHVRWRMLGGIAAAASITLGALVFAQKAPTPSSFATVNHPARHALTLLEESGQVEDATNAGTVEESDGTSLQAWRYHVIERNRMKDQTTGLVVEVSQPRDEFLLTPVSAF